MDRNALFAYAAERYGTQPDYPWQDENAVLRHGNGKWYGVVLAVGKAKLGLAGEGKVDVLNIKCDPVLIGSLLPEPGFHPAYHMNKDKWISVRLDGSVPPEEVTALLDLSHRLTASAKKKLRNMEK